MAKDSVQNLVAKLESERSPYELLKIVEKLGALGEEAKPALQNIKELQEKFHKGDFGRWSEWESWRVDDKFRAVFEKIRANT